MVGGGGQDQGLAVNFDFDTRLPHCVAHRVSRFVHREQFHPHSRPIGELNLLCFVQIQIHRAEERRSDGRWIRRL
jgi:hypothetical protein